MTKKSTSSGKKRRGLSQGAAAYSGLFLLFVILFLSGTAGLLSTNLMRYLLQIFLYIALGQAWNLLSGFAGMTSLGQQLYIGLAGYAVAVATASLGLSPYAGIGLGIAAGILVSAALSLILFRMEGMYFAIATWIAAEAVEKVFLNTEYVGQGSGMTVRIVPYPSVTWIYLASILICCFSIASVCLVLHSRLGLGLMAMRDDPAAAQACGVNLVKARLSVYILAAVICALTGSLFFIHKGTIYPESGFSSGWTVSSVFICIIGGTGTIAGPAAGAVLYVLLGEFLAHYPGWSNIMLGAVTLLVIFFLPEGIAGFIHKKTGISLFTRRRRADTASGGFHAGKEGGSGP